MLGLGAAVAVLAVAACLGVGAVLTDRASVERTSDVLTAFSSLRGQLHDAQRGEQGFALTADEHYLQPYDTAAAQMPRTLSRLRQLIGGDRASRQRIDDLQASVDAAIDSLGNAVRLLRTEGFTAVRPTVLGTAGSATMANAEQVLDALYQDEVTVLRAQRRHEAQQADAAIAIIAAAVVAATALVAARAWSIARARTVDPTTADTPAPEAVAPDALEPQSAWHAPLRVLLAEDSPVNQKVAQFMLGKLGHHVDTVANGLEAVRALRSADYDVVLMDVQMPVLDGLEATRLIRSDLPADRQPHIIAMTASALIEDRTACRTAGMNDYLPKPVRLPDLISALTPLLVAGQEEQSDDAVAGNAVPTHVPSDTFIDRAKKIRARLGDISDGEPTGPERELLARLLSSFTAHTPVGIDRLAELLAAGDLVGVRNQAHALNGSASNIGATHLAQMFAEAEAGARAGRLPDAAATMAAIRSEYGKTAPVCVGIADELSLAVRR